MNLEDARKLSPEAQQVLRQRAVAAVVDKGRSQGEVAQELGVTRTAVNQWVQRYRRRGASRANHSGSLSASLGTVVAEASDACQGAVPQNGSAVVSHPVPSLA
jgi:transposase-like protein